MPPKNPVASHGEKRREAGRARFTRVLGFMLQDLSHPELAALADWATNEPGCLHTSQISHLRNQKMRMLGVKSLDALGLINVCSYYYKTEQRDKLKESQVASVTPKIEDIISRYEPIVQDDIPLNAGDYMMIYLGHLDLEILHNDNDDLNWALLSEKFSPWIEDLLIEKGLRTRQAIEEIRIVWTGPAVGKDKLCACIAGMDEFTEADLPTLWPHITHVISHFMDDEISESDLIDMMAG